MSPRIVLLLLAVVVGMAGCQRSFLAVINAGSADVPARDVVYDREHGTSLTVYPATTAARDAPVALFFYGGSWQGGRREDYAFVGETLARCGVTTAIADYRKSPEVRFPVFVEDAARALAWTHGTLANARDDGTRPPLFLIGHSAGAHLTGLLATDARYLAPFDLQPRDLRGAIGIAGPYDFLPLTDPDIQAAFGPRSGWPASQPINFVDGDEPPFLLLHGSDDRIVWTRNSERLAAKLDGVGVPADLRLYPDLGHIRILVAIRFPRLAPTLRDTLHFIAARGGAIAPECLEPTGLGD